MMINLESQLPSTTKLT
jgi:tRNA U34 5-carboxymethylaminomethyl modifying GTPase MnmE/TrmE